MEVRSFPAEKEKQQEKEKETTKQQEKEKDTLKQQEKESNTTTQYAVGIYARLSVDVEERKRESIETQIEIAKAFVAGQKDMVIVDCYTDIGKTGTSFMREGFVRMMQDVRKRRINCIIVKDLSRFGRNHIEMGNYLEKIFPFMGVRFIAVTDHFDSVRMTEQKEVLSVHLKNLVNEMYAKDIAAKVRASRQARWEQGSYTGAVVPYGYRAEWIGDKRCLFPEKTTADIVKKIFALFLAGKTGKEIVLWLYEEKILPPSEYRKTGQIYCRVGEKPKEWSQETVKRILKNPVYMGCLVQGRGTPGNDGKQNEARIKGKQDAARVEEKQDAAGNEGKQNEAGNEEKQDEARTDEIPDEPEAVIKRHTHAAIVSEAVFLQAATGWKRASGYSQRNGCASRAPVMEDIFSEVLFCGVCGAKMKRSAMAGKKHAESSLREYRYDCPQAGRGKEKGCLTKGISLKVLSDIVKEAIRKQLLAAEGGFEEVVEANNREAKRIKAGIYRKLSLLDKRMENQRRLSGELYRKYRMGEIDGESFCQKKEESMKKHALFQKQRREWEERLAAIDREVTQSNQFVEDWITGSEGAVLTEEVIRAFVARIEGYPGNRVRILFAFREGKQGEAEENLQLWNRRGN